MSQSSLLRPTRLRATRLGAGLAVAASLLLTGCGVAGTDFQPGIAARVGDRTVTSDEVDDLTTAACAAFQDGLAQDNQVVPLSVLRATVAQNLALTDAALQLGEQYGVEPGERYQRQLTANRATTTNLPDDQARAVEVVQTTSDLLSDVLGQVGATIAADAAPADSGSGSGDATTDPASDEALQVGATALQDWLGSHRVELDPKLGVELDADGLSSADTSISFAVSDVAAAGAADEPDPQDVMQLPASQRCGSYSF